MKPRMKLVLPHIVGLGSRGTYGGSLPGVFPADVVFRGVCRAVKAIKPLGCLAMIDDGELDWKVCYMSSVRACPCIFFFIIRAT